MAKWILVPLLILALLPQIISPFFGASFTWLGPQKWHHIHWNHPKATLSDATLELAIPFWDLVWALVAPPDQRTADGQLIIKEATVKNNRVQTTPIDFHLKNGVANIERVDALIDNALHICLWGKIDTATQTLDLTLGLPADLLASHFKLPDLPSHYVLTVPIRGTIENPEIAAGTAAAKVAALLAAGKVEKKGILGFLAELIAWPLEEEEAPTPKYPFTWQEN